MTRRVIRPQSRHHLWLYDEDWQFVVHHAATKTKLPPGSWIREMLHRVVTQLREERHMSQESAMHFLETLEKGEEEPDV